MKMGDLRKRGRKPKTPPPATVDSMDCQAKTTTSTKQHETVSSPSTDPTTTAANNDPSPSRRGRGRPRKIRKHHHSESSEPGTTVLSSPERRTRHQVEQNGDCNGVLAGEPSPKTLSLAPHWDSVVKVVPAMDAVVKVFCVHTEPNFSLPWQRKRQYSSSSSGFIVKGRRVLTNAHSVEHHTQVKVKKRGSDTKYLATVLAIGTECDIGINLYAYGFCFAYLVM